MAKRGIIFNSLSQRRIKRNAFNLSYENKLSCNMKKLVPFMVNDVLPHDTFKVLNEYLMKAQPLIAPIMHRVGVYQHYFYVPLRLLWSGFEEFITGGKDGKSDLEHPNFSASFLYTQMHDIQREYDAYKSDLFEDTWIEFYNHLKCFDSFLSLLDYLGYPFNKGCFYSLTGEVDSLNNPIYTFDSAYINSFQNSDDKYDSMRLRAYFFIYDNYYRDQNLQDPIFEDFKYNVSISSPVWKDSVNDDAYLNLHIQNGLDFVLYRAWKKDYFTSALPFQQRGPEVFLQNSAPVEFDPTKGVQLLTNINPTPAGAPPYKLAGQAYESGDGLKTTLGYTNPSGDSVLGTTSLDPNGSFIARLKFSINDLRLTNALQRFYEKAARNGARYIESILAHWGIRPKDYRLDRPEYLGGGKQPLNITTVVQTSATDDEKISMTPQGNQSGNATAYNQQYVFSQTFDEHGIIIGLLSVLPTASYQQGLDRRLVKSSRFDYPFPEFANLGEQEVYSNELFYKPGNKEVFGYQSRYAEYKYNFDQVHGDFKTTLKFWHLGRIFDNVPQLNEQFIFSPATKRVFAVEDENEDCLLFDFYNQIDVLRALPQFGTPAL